MSFHWYILLQTDLQSLLYPMFVHLFLEMIYGGHKSAGEFQS